MMGGMAEKGNSAASEAGMAVLAAVRGLRGDLSAVQETQETGGDVAGFAVVLAAMSRPMVRDWSPAEKYQAIALLGVTVQWLSMVTEMSEEEILAELESNYH